MQISIKSNIDQVTKGLSDIQKNQIPFVASKTLNQLAQNISRKVMPDKADKTFQGGAVPFTKRAFKYRKSTKRDLVSSVFVDPITHKYMTFMVSGGTRFPENRSILVSTRHSKLNRYGNIPRATLQKMINDKKKYFKGVPKGQPSAGEGIWERYGRKTSPRIRMVAMYKKDAQYRPLFPFGTFGKIAVFSRADGFTPIFIPNLELELASAK